MKRKICFLFLLTVMYVGKSCSQQEDVIKPNEKLGGVYLADPFILYHNDTYYAYGTASPDGIEVLVSKDLQLWERPASVNQNLALRRENSYGKEMFWAPEVFHVNGKFYMLYSAQRQICVAVADSPLGPFVQQVKQPLYDDFIAIDNTLFVDDDGKIYMYFVALTDPENPGYHLIYVAEMHNDLLSMKMETMKLCFGFSQPWENIDGQGINEGPFVIKHNGRYWMTYSGNGFDHPDYAVGFATADHPAGPWDKYESNPIFRRPKHLLGVGHSSMFVDKEGALKKVFHAWREPDSAKIHPRQMYITNVYFEELGGEEIMVIDTNFVTPKYRHLIND